MSLFRFNSTNIVSTSLKGLKERNKNTGDVTTHLCGGGGRLEVFTGTDSNGGGHTGLLFCGDTAGGRVVGGAGSSEVYSGKTYLRGN